MSMYLFAILSSLICIQLISTVSSDTSDANPSSQSNVLIQKPIISDNDNENDEEYINVPRSSTFLRFGRQTPTASASFLRTGENGGKFLRTGENGGKFLLTGENEGKFLPTGENGGKFLRFGRQSQQTGSNNFLRFGKKGEFLKFG